MSKGTKDQESSNTSNVIDVARIVRRSVQCPSSLLVASRPTKMIAHRSAYLKTVPGHLSDVTGVSNSGIPALPTSIPLDSKRLAQVSTTQRNWTPSRFEMRLLRCNDSCVYQRLSSLIRCIPHHQHGLLMLLKPGSSVKAQSSSRILSRNCLCTDLSFVHARHFSAR
jgi:hypothetical protein